MSKIPGPDRYFVDAQGEQLGVFRDAIDSKTGDIVAPVGIPDGAIEADTPPPSRWHRWDGAGWVEKTAERRAFEDAATAKADRELARKGNAVLQALKDATPTQIDNYVDNNVANLADAKALFKAILYVLADLVRE